LVTILEAKSLAPAILFPDLTAKFQEFDRSSATVKACTILHSVLEFLWAVYHKKIPPSVIGVDQSQDAKDWSKRIHQSNIVPVHLQMGPPHFVPPPPFPPPQDQSSNDSRRTLAAWLLRDATEKQHQREISNDEEKKNSSNGWEKLPEEVQLMVICLSATSDEHLPLVQQILTLNSLRLLE
jgi:hypothetical protein